MGGHQKFVCFFHAAYPCLRQSVAVAVIKCLRHVPLGHAASSCWLRAYMRGSGLPGTPPSFLSCLLWHSSSSEVNCSLVLRAAYAAVCDGYPFQEATSFFLLLFFLCQVFRQLAAANVLAILGECACFCSCGAFSLTFPVLLVLRSGLNSPPHKLGGLRSSAQFAFHQLSVIRST